MSAYRVTEDPDAIAAARMLAQFAKPTPEAQRTIAEIIGPIHEANERADAERLAASESSERAA